MSKCAHVGAAVVGRTRLRDVTDISITARYRKDAPPGAFEALVLGTVLPEEEGFRIFLEEKMEWEQKYLAREGAR